MHQQLCRLSHELYELLLKLEEHIPPADGPAKHLMYDSKRKLKEISEAAQRASAGSES